MGARKLWQSQASFVCHHLPRGFDQHLHSCTADEEQSFRAELGDSTPALSNVVEDHLVLQEGTEGTQHMDVKALLKHYCEKVCRRPLTKTDILYTISQHGPSQFSATVNLYCVGGEKFRGGVCSTKPLA